MLVEEIGAGPPVVYLHSSGLSSRQWKRLATTLAEKGFRSLLVDLGGHGRAVPIPYPEPFSIAVDVRDVARLLERQVEPVHVVGHSYGALVGLLVAREMPQKIASLALFEPVAFGMLDPAVHHEACEELRRAATDWGTGDAEHEAWLRTFVDYWSGAGAWNALREDARQEFRRVGWAVHEGVRSLLEDRTPVSAYSVITAPLLLMTAEKSPLAARTVVELLGAAHANARVVRFDDGLGHMAPLTHPGRVNDAIANAVIAARDAQS